MKRLLTFSLLLLSASAGFAEDGILISNTVLRTGNSLMILKAGTVVHILGRNEKTLSVKVGDKTGLIPWSAVETYSEADMMSASSKPVLPAPAPTPAGSATVKTAPTSAPAPTVTPAPARPAQTMYGKAVEKAAAAAASHEKTLVSPTDDVLGGK